METNILRFKIFLDKRPNGIVRSNNVLSQTNTTDFYINIPITKTYKKVDDYINVDKSPLRTYVKRQNFNPYFIELSFFETIKGISNSGNTSIIISNVQENVEQKSQLFNITINKF